MSETIKSEKTYVLDNYFDETTMSLHLKADRPILRKKWTPGNRNPVMDEKIITQDEMDALIQQIFDEATNENEIIWKLIESWAKFYSLGHIELW